MVSVLTPRVTVRVVSVLTPRVTVRVVSVLTPRVTVRVWYLFSLLESLFVCGICSNS